MKQSLIILLIFSAVTVFAQYSPGELPFTYLNIAASPISSALSMSGAAAMTPYRDIFNPASVYFNDDINDIYFSYTGHFASSHFGYIEYNMPSMRIGVKYFNSGSMEKRDSLNNYLGDFSDNTLFIHYSYGYSISEKLSLGASVLGGMENIDNFNQYAVALSAGMIYRFSELITVGFYSGNAGIGYSDGIDVLPARIIAGAKIGNSNSPVNLYVDAGKILDSDYFYSAGAELHVLRKTEKTTEQDIEEYENIDVKVEELDPEIPENVMSEDTMAAEIINEIISTDSTSVIEDEFAAEDTDTIYDDEEADTLSSEEETFMSYADYLEQMENSKENNDEAETGIETEMGNTETVTSEGEQTISKRPSFMNQFGFVLRGGISSDKQMLQSGTSLDLVAGLSAGFGLTFRNYQVDYAAKFWGELGIGHSVGVKVVF